MIRYTDYISSSPLAGDLGELIGKLLLSDTPADKPCAADVFIAMVYYAWMNGLLESPQEGARPRRKARLMPNNWSRRALCMMAATTGNAWRAIYSEGKFGRGNRHSHLTNLADGSSRHSQRPSPATFQLRSSKDSTSLTSRTWSTCLPSLGTQNG